MVATVIYHADCLDGFGAAWAAWRKFGPAATYRPLHHGETCPEDEISGRDVFILDFSFSPGELEQMATQALSVTLIDHHATARAPWADRLSPDRLGRETYRDDARHLRVIFDMERSGAALAWQHFHPDEAIPLLLRHIEDIDLWRFALPGTRPICRALRLNAFDFAAWDRLAADAAEADSAGYRDLLLRGEAIEQFYRTEVARLADGNLVMPVRLRGEPVDAMQALRHGQTVVTDGESHWLAIEGLAVNASALFASELGNTLAERSGTFGAVWQLSADGEAKVSLRSKGSFDVSTIAARYGGGGHRNAAGFRLSVSAFLTESLSSHRSVQTTISS